MKPVILIIDKDPGNLMDVYDRLISEFGSTICLMTFSDFSEAISYCEETTDAKENLLATIFDTAEQKISGWDFLKKTVSFNFRVKSILMTEKADIRNLSEIINKIVLEYLLPKPVNLDNLAEKVTEILNARESKKRKQDVPPIKTDYKERYYRLLKTVNDILYELDENLGVVSIEGDVEKLGYDESLFTRKDLVLQDFVHPEDVPLLLKNYKVNQHGKTAVFQLRLKTASGSFRWAEVSSFPLSSSKEYKGTFGSIQLIHKRKMTQDALQKSQERLRETNQRLQFAFEASNEGYWDQDMITGQTFYSPQYYTLLGYQPYEFKANQINWFKLVHPDDQPYISEQVNKLLSGKINKIECIIRMKAKDQTWKWIMEKAIPVELDENKNPIRIIGTHMDVSQLKETELELIKAKQLAEEATRLKTSFLANMSHEIRTPLNSIVGFSNMLTRQDIDETKRGRFMEIIRSNTEHLLTLINDILDISRIQSGQMKMTIEPIEVRKLMEKIYDSYLVTQKKKGLEKIDFILKIPEKTADDRVMADKNRLMQIISNLIDNAFKFTTAGRITIGYERPNESDIYFYVKDTGIGIAEDNHDLIFDRFRQEENGHKRHFGGTGLGLAICKSLAEMMNGEIGVESKKDKGSEFFIILPAK